MEKHGGPSSTVQLCKECRWSSKSFPGLLWRVEGFSQYIGLNNCQYHIEVYLRYATRKAISGFSDPDIGTWERVLRPQEGFAEACRVLPGSLFHCCCFSLLLLGKFHGTDVQLLGFHFGRWCLGLGTARLWVDIAAEEAQGRVCGM